MVAFPFVLLQVSAENCNVSALDNMFRTPLHWAAVLGTVLAASLMELIANIASVKVFVCHSLTFWLSLSTGHSKICGMLLDSNADYQSSDSNGATPLHYAAQNNFEVRFSGFKSSSVTLNCMYLPLPWGGVRQQNWSTVSSPCPFMNSLVNLILLFISSSSNGCLVLRPEPWHGVQC